MGWDCGTIARACARPLRGAAVCLAALAVLGAGPSGLGTDRVIVVLTSDAQPYVAAANAAKEEIERKGAQVRVVELSKEKDRASWASLPVVGVMAVGTEAAQHLYRTLPERSPLAYCMVADPGAAGLHTGRLVHGVSTDVTLDDQIALIVEALPRASSVGAIYRSGVARSAQIIADLRAALPQGWRLTAVDLDASESVAAAIREMLASKPDVVWTSADSAVYNAGTVQALLKDCLSARVPVFGFSTQFVRAGALLGVGVRPEDQGRVAARMLLEAVAKAAPSGAPERPIHEQARARVAVNLLVAERLGIVLPADLVRRADDVFGSP